MKVRFDQLAINVKEKKKPTEEDRHHYIGLEHLDSGSLTVSRWGADVAPKGEKLLMKKGDVLFGKRRAYQKKVAIAPFDGIFSAHGMVLRPNERIIDKAFFPLFISSDYFLDAAIALSVGSLSPTINWKDLARLEFELPSLEKQHELAEVLWAIEDTRTAYQRLEQATEELVKSRFIEMFGDPVTNPMGWEKINLGSLSLTANNGMARRGNDADGNIVLRLVELQSGKIDYSNPNRISLTDKEKQRYLLQDKDFLFVRVNGNPENVGRCAVFHEIAEPIYHNDHIIRYHFDEERIDGTFLSVLLNSPYGKSQFKPQLKTSAGQYTVSQSGIDIVEIPLPPIALQNQFADFVALTDKSKVVLQKSVDSLQKLKAELMYKYLG